MLLRDVVRNAQTAVLPNIPSTSATACASAGSLTATTGRTLAVRLVVRDAYRNLVPHSALNLSALKASLFPRQPGSTVSFWADSDDTSWVLLR